MEQFPHIKAETFKTLAVETKSKRTEFWVDQGVVKVRHGKVGGMEMGDWRPLRAFEVQAALLAGGPIADFLREQGVR